MSASRGAAASGIMRGMHKLTRSAAVAFVLFTAVLAASCRHANPRTMVLGPITCEPEKGDSKCFDCVKASCCAEMQACTHDAPCPCWYIARFGQMPLADALDRCGPPNEAYKTLASCLDSRCAAGCPREVHEHPLIGKPAPEISARPVGGQGPKTLKDALGKVVILEFWGTFCEPCKRTFRTNQEILERFPNDVAVLALSVDDPETATRDRLLAFAKDRGATFSILWDDDGSTRRAYAKPSGVPSTFILDRRGTVRHLHDGYRGEDAKIAREVESLVKAPPSQGP